MYPIILITKLQCLEYDEVTGDCLRSRVRGAELINVGKHLWYAFVANLPSPKHFLRISSLGTSLYASLSKKNLLNQANTPHVANEANSRLLAPNRWINTSPNSCLTLDRNE